MIRTSKTICYLLLAVLAASVGCSRRNANPATADPVTPAKVSAEDITKLKWIEGTWRGMDGDKPFVERYRFEGTTMLVDSFEDESLAQVSETSRFELRDGEFGSTNVDRRSVATSLTDESIQFAPVTPGQGNFFRFERQQDGNWNAVLEWQATGNQPARKKVYEMKRWPPPR